MVIDLWKMWFFFLFFIYEIKVYMMEVIRDRYIFIREKKINKLYEK